MSDDKTLKSAYDLAMERLKADDDAAGVVSSAPLTEDQKQTIATMRREAQAKIAEISILHAQSVAEAAGDPEKLKELQENFETDKARVLSRIEGHVARIRRGESIDES